MEIRKRGHRKKHMPPLKKTHVSITEDQAKLLRAWGKGDLSAGLRWLICAATPFITKLQINPENKSKDLESE